MYISVVIPVYDEEVLLGKCLQALSHQKRPPNEIVVVDNNSTDASVKIARQFEKVRVVTETRQGMAYARDCGFKNARGDIVCQTDADSLPPYDWIYAIEE